MNKRILITGATGFIGRHITRQLNIRKYDLSLLVRPGTNKKRLAGFPEKAEIIPVDLGNIKNLKQVLKGRNFDVIVHVGAIRNRPKTNLEDYQKANIFSTEQLALKAMDTGAKFIFFSSVGIFGAVPKELPATEETELNADNLYHWSKIEAEKLIDRYVLYGLKASVIRPAITYGPGDFGFPYSLIKMIDKKRILLPVNSPLIHLANVETLVMAVKKIIEIDDKPGSIYNIADCNPVNLMKLADFVNKELKNKPFPRALVIPDFLFKLGVKFFHFLRNPVWENRFKLFSQSWYYEVDTAYQNLNLKHTETIPGIRSTIEWYKKIKEIRKT